MQTFEAAFTWKLEKPTQLLAFLLGIAEHKVLDAQRRFSGCARALVDTYLFTSLRATKRPVQRRYCRLTCSLSRRPR